MTEIMAYCSFTCQTCLIYPASMQADPEVQARIRLEIVRVVER